MADVSDQILGDSQIPLDLSVLIVTFNSAETIVACIKSVVAEIDTLQAEIIVVDNNSADRTPMILKDLAAAHKNIKLVLSPHNRGFAIGNNQALEKSTGEQVLILNPDTIIHKGTLAGLLSALKKDDKVAITAPKMQFPDGRTQKTCRRFPRHLDVIYNSFGLAQLFPKNQHFNAWKMGDFDHESTRQVDQPAGAALMIRGTVLRELQGFDPNFPMFFNDVDLCKRVKDAGHEIWFISDLVMDHVGGASVKQAKVKMTLSSHVSFFRYFEKHFTRVHQQPLNFLVGVLLYTTLIPRLILLAFQGGSKTRSGDTL